MSKIVLAIAENPRAFGMTIHSIFMAKSPNSVETLHVAVRYPSGSAVAHGTKGLPACDPQDRTASPRRRKAFTPFGSGQDKGLARM